MRRPVAPSTQARAVPTAGPVSLVFAAFCGVFALTTGAGCEWLGGIDERTLAVPTSAGAGGSGGASASTSTSGGGGDGGQGGGPARCPDGPYGPDALYFGDPVVWAGFDAMKGFGALAPSGLRFVKSAGTVTDAEGCIGTCFKLEEHTRTELDGAWAAPASFLVSYVGDWPHVVLNDLGLFACHGGELKCAYYERATITESYPFDTTHDFWSDAEFGIMKANGGAADHAFAPTPDGRFIAFASDRMAPNDDTGLGQEQIDLWTAEAVVPGNPTKGYTNLVKHALASSPDPDFPSWISDDAGTVVLSSHQEPSPTPDLYVVSRDAPVDTFGPPQKLVSLSRDGIVEDGFSIPSIATLAAHGNVGEGFVRWSTSTSQREYRTFPVCLGSANP